tara:strand:- start:539 stop:853 length:315 start_codon:yes stop_codon:yes gene_type:complete
MSVFRLHWRTRNKLNRFQNKLNELYKERDNYIKHLHDKYGANSILIARHEDGWEKIILRNDLEKLKSGVSSFRPARFSIFELDRRIVTNRPREADEVFVPENYR